MPFRLPTRVTLAAGCVEQLSQELTNLNARRVLLVTDVGLQSTRWPAAVRSSLKKLPVEVEVEAGIEQNPRYETIDAIADRARGSGVEVIVGLGGGSVLAASKAVAMLLKNPGSCLDYEGRNRFTNGSAPFIAIPTTCGTGSEVTWVSVITHAGQHRKLSVKGDAMFPSVALVDPDVIASLPARLIAYTGMDALTHALEACTVNCANPISDALAEKAITLLFGNLETLVQNPADKDARFAVMRASTLAGMAFGNADVGGVHCLSETIGGMYDVPHGLANAMFLVPVMRYHEPFIRSRLAEIHTVLFGEADLPEMEKSGLMLEKIDALRRKLEIPGFASLNLAMETHRPIAEGAIANGSNASNPQPMNVEAYLEILTKS